MPDPFTGNSVRVLAVKGSGGDIGSIKESGFALLYLDRLEQLKGIYRGEAFEDEMVSFYPLSAFGESKVAASIDTALHAFLPYDHVDHLHPDWAIAIAASANGERKMQEFNKAFGRKIVWLPWQRPGFELALMLENAERDNPGAEGIILGSHGLFTWGHTQRECYLNSIETIDQMGRFIAAHEKKKSTVFGGILTGPRRRSPLRCRRHSAHPARRRLVQPPPDRPLCRSRRCPRLRRLRLGQRALRTRHQLPRPLPPHPHQPHVCRLEAWRGKRRRSQESRIAEQAVGYRAVLRGILQRLGEIRFPKLRDSNPSVIVIPGLGLFGFGKNKKEARITTEFFINAIHVMSGAAALDDDDVPNPLPQARVPEQSQHFATAHNYVALPRPEAFKIEYWALEEAKLQRMPAEAEFSRKILLIVGGGSGIGREVAIMLAKKRSAPGSCRRERSLRRRGLGEVAKLTSTETVSHVAVNLCSSESLAAAIRHTILQFGGIDGIVNTAAIFPVGGPGGQLTEGQWSTTFQVNVTGNYLLAREAKWVFSDQKLPSTMVLTSSANAVVSKHGSEAYDVSKTALNHLIRELAVGLGPTVRVNGIAPATVVAGSTMFPRDRVMQSLAKYKIAFSRIRIHRRTARQAGQLLRPADSHQTSHPAEGLRATALCGSRPAGCRARF
jgi:rhamnose utilization protein RhaD (predicted bifunctional aldolase and dehydrogenase)/NAD(P)-dependent dehydrogenase (short-subunit alcohol dehydrogenase family)